MTSALTTEYIARRMQELGHGSSYTLRLRHLIIMGGIPFHLQAGNHLFILMEPFSDVRIESSAGLFDMSEVFSPELQYEHRGDITITNATLFPVHVRFIQVIPTIQ